MDSCKLDKLDKNVGIFTPRCLVSLAAVSPEQMLIFGGFDGKYLQQCLQLTLPKSLAICPDSNK